MIIRSQKVRRLIRLAYRGLGVTAVSLMFQACYGMPPAEGNDVGITGVVTAEKTGEPVPGIKVTIQDTAAYELTGDDGSFYIYAPKQDRYIIKFEDIDGNDNNGSFSAEIKDITLADAGASMNIILTEDDK